MPQAITAEKLAALDARLAALQVSAPDLLERFVRGSGAGGQKLNKTSSCVFLKHLPSGVCVKCQVARSREVNRFVARRELCDQLEAIRDGRARAHTQAIAKLRRQKRRRSRRSKQQSTADKRLRGLTKALRRAPQAE